MSKRTIAVDLDGCLAQYDGWVSRSHIGEPLPGAVDAMTKLAAAGFEIVVFTCRCNPANDEEFSGDITCQQAAQVIREWLGQHRFPIWGMTVWEEHGKPFATAYLDDRAVCVAPQRNPDAWPMVTQALLLTAEVGK